MVPISRYNPDKPDSILEHALEDKKIEFLYKESEWDAFSGFFSAGACYSNRRSMLQLELDRDQYVAFLRELADIHVRFQNP